MTEFASRSFCSFERSLREKCPNSKYFLVRIFLYSDWIRGFTEQISVFSPNTGKCEPKKLRICTLFTHWIFEKDLLVCEWSTFLHKDFIWTSNFKSFSRATPNNKSIVNHQKEFIWKIRHKFKSCTVYLKSECFRLLKFILPKVEESD